MSFIIRNIAGAPIEIDDIGIRIEAGQEISLIEEAGKDIAISADLVSAIQALDIIVLDPLDGSTPLTVAQSVEAVQAANDPHFRIKGGELVQLDDVDLTGLVDGYQLTYESGSGNWIPAPPGGTSTGEANTASNLGTGEGWYAQKVGVELQFKSIKAGSAITLTPSPTEILVAVDDTAINHINLLNVGLNTHTQIDAHIGDATIHFTEGSISHFNILDIGINTHIQIDTHIADLTNPHVTRIDNLNDVVLTSPAVGNGNVLVYNLLTDTWINAPLAVGGSGRLIQVQFGPIASIISTASTLLGPTAPLITEGVEVWSQPFTPVEISSNIRIATAFTINIAQNNTQLVVSFFRDALCVGVSLVTGTTKKFSYPFATTMYDTPGTLTPVVYSCRVGKDTGTTWYLNRTSDTVTVAGLMEQQAYTVEEIGVSP